MSLPEINPDRPYTGSPMGDPRAEKIGTFSCLLSQQTTEFQAAVASLRAGHTSHQTDYTGMPTSIELVMSDGTLIQSRQAETVSISPKSKSIRLVLNKWDGPRFTWAIVDIDGDGLAVVVRRKPHDPWNDWRPISPTIIPPATAVE